MLMSTPLGKGLGDFLGGIGGILGAVGTQLETCNKDGYFNVSKGCWVGVGGIAIGVVFGGAWIASKVIDTRNANINKQAQLKGESISKTVSDFAKSLDLKMNELSGSKIDSAAIRKALNRKAANSLNETLKSSNLKPDDLKELSAASKQVYEAEESAIGEDFGLSEEEDAQADQVATEFEEPPVFEV